jgi:SHS2 domain-containing protein
MGARWEHFPHEADMGVRGYGATIDEAFAQAALALIAVITDPAGVDARETVAVRCDAPDRDLLLVDWLNALIFEIAANKMLFSRFEVHVDNHHLSALAWGEPIDPARHQPAVEVKGATLTALRVSKEKSGEWMAQCIVDV